MCHLQLLTICLKEFLLLPLDIISHLSGKIYGAESFWITVLLQPLSFLPSFTLLNLFQGFLFIQLLSCLIQLMAKLDSHSLLREMLPPPLPNRSLSSFTCCQSASHSIKTLYRVLPVTCCLKVLFRLLESLTCCTFFGW